MARFFIDRSVFAWVVSILIMVLGGLAITQLPIAQYPSVAPPSISVTANYAGASAETLQETVTSIIEQRRLRFGYGDFVFPAGNESGYGAGAGAEQGATGDVEPAANGAATGRGRG